MPPDQVIKSYSDLYHAITELSLDDPRREPLINLWHDLEENTAEVALSKFDSYIGDLSEACVKFYLGWAKARLTA